MDIEEETYTIYCDFIFIGISKENAWFSNINYIYLVTLIVGFDFVAGLIAIIEIVRNLRLRTLWILIK